MKYLAIAVLVVSLSVFTGGSLGMALKIEPFFSWYYLFAWWPYIAGASAVLALKGYAPDLFYRPLRFFLYAFASAGFWLVFEILNFRLGNWHYINLPQNLYARWLSYFFSFATVLPALAVTRQVLSACNLFSRVIVQPVSVGLERSQVLKWAGCILLLMSMAWPKYFYYLVWIGPIFIMDPILYQSGKKSILTDWQNMDLSFWAQAFMSGLACGFLWEMWNYWSGAKWYYTVPLVGNLKLFEMPVLGFLGFPVFALEAFLFMGLLDLGREKLAKMDAPRQAFLTLAIVLLVLFFDLAVFWGIDEFTVVSLAAK